VSAARAIGVVRAIGARVPRERLRDRPLILVYHRVDQLPIDPQSLAVRRERFARQLELVAEKFVPLPLRELTGAVRAGRVPRRAVALTFDDGYADNLVVAKPLLEEIGVPATVFVASGFVREERPFWWDELERILLRPGRLPDVVKLAISGQEVRVDFGDEADYGPETSGRRASWTVLDDRDPGPRQAAYRRLCSILRGVDEGERESTLQRLRAVLLEADGVRTPDLTRPLTCDELVELAEDGLVEIGAHTVSHPVLAFLPYGRQREEVAGSKRDLEQILDRPVSSFAYPYGGRPDFDNSAVSIARGLGFERACTTFPGRVTRQTDLFRLPRVVVRDWTADELERRLEAVR
jgi:peptidoglycan/xylan/chitin deacetylase (PgdA/CDA1 family)